jgi:hypothetical protein
VDTVAEVAQEVEVEKLLEHLVIHLQETVALTAEAAEELMTHLLVVTTHALEMGVVAL